MNKNECVTLPKRINSLIIGLGWDCHSEVDVDASVVCLDKNKNTTSIIYFNNKFSGGGVQHEGDARTGAGKGDDERIRIDLHQVPEQTHELYITVNVFTLDVNFT